LDIWLRASKRGKAAGAFTLDECPECLAHKSDALLDTSNALSFLQ
jgi:hypothetical protein